MSARRHLLTRTVRQVLQSGKTSPKGRCSLTRPLYGAAWVSLLFHLDRHSLVRITNWGSTKGCGLEIGTISSLGAQALKQGFFL